MVELLRIIFLNNSIYFFRVPFLFFYAIIIIYLFMKTLNLILLIVLILLSLSTGITKLIQMPAEMELFRHAGFSDTLTIIFGVIQVIGGLLLIPSKYRKYGALIMLITFVIASVVVFIKGMMLFGLGSLSFIVLAGYQYQLAKNKS